MTLKSSVDKFAPFQEAELSIGEAESLSGGTEEYIILLILIAC